MNSFQLTSQLPTARGKGLWTLDGLLISPLSTFPVRMTIIRVSDQGLFLISSFPPTEQVLALLRPLGSVRLLLAPNALHCLWGCAMRDVSPGALLAGPPKAAQRFPVHGWDVVIQQPGDLHAVLAQQGLASGGEDIRAWCTMEASPWMQEIVVLHRPSGTLVLTDLAFNFKKTGGEAPLPGGPLGVLLRHTYLRLAGGYRTCCPTAPMGWLLDNAEAMAAIVDDIVSCDFDQVVVAHGDLVLAPGGKRAFAEGAAAFYKDVAARRRHHQHASSLRMHPALVAAAAVAGIAAVLWWRSG